MRAVTYHEYGPPSVLAVGERPEPQIGEHQVLVRVFAVEVTKSDCELRAMRFPVKWFALPLRVVWGWSKPRKPVLGGYFAGRVERVGAAVHLLRAGEEVYGSVGLNMGAYAELLCVHESASLAKKPSTLAFTEAATIPLGGMNALHFMRRAHIAPAQHVLILGAGGSIGSYAVQIAKQLGAVVTAVDGPHKLGWLRALGADHVVDYTREDALSTGKKYDVIFSTIAANHYDECLAALTPAGCYLTANPRLADLLRSVWTNWRSTKRVVVAFAPETREVLEELAVMAERGQIRATIDSCLPLEDAVTAHTRVESELRIGSVVLVPSKQCD